MVELQQGARGQEEGGGKRKSWWGGTVRGVGITERSLVE